MWRGPVSLVNARVVTADGLASSLRFSSRILEIDARPKRGDVVVDLDGAFVLPGLVNGHDHLELNHFGRRKFRDAYENASDWIDDMRPRLREDPEIRAGRAHSLADRLFIGGLKNALSGATTVAHHNPYYRELRWRFPVRLVRPYGWAHSFALEGQPVGARGEAGYDVSQAHRATPRGAPFVIHLGEGVDDRASRELSRLDALGCLDERTVLVHGVALTVGEWQRVAERGAGLVWCPSSNRFLLGRTAPVREFLDCGPGPAPICLGTDSRLTGARDLLDELSEAKASGVTPSELLPMVTTAAAALLRLEKAGRIDCGLPADLVVVPPLREDPASALVEATRSQLQLVTIGGLPLVAAPGLYRVFEARAVRASRVKLDGQDRLIPRALASRIRACRIAERGLEVDA